MIFQIIKEGGLRFKLKFQKGGVKKFWIKGGTFPERGGENFKGGWIPGHNFPSISNFIFSFSQQMTF